MDNQNKLRERADALTHRSGAGFFEFRDDGGHLVGVIEATDRPRVQGPWRVQSAYSLGDDRVFQSWTAAVFYLKALYVEALVR